MKVLGEYKIKYGDIHDVLIVFSPDSDSERRDMYRFRYVNYLKHGYIADNKKQLDVDEYDYFRDTFYINIYSNRERRVFGSLRIINTKPLPIEKDCFEFNAPLLVRLFSRHRILEIGRLIVEKYNQTEHLPRHMAMFILIDQILRFSRNKKIYFGYAFIKESLFNKLKDIKFPFFTIKPYRQKYIGGVLEKYFSQQDNKVVPVYFIYFFVRLYLWAYFLIFKKVIVK